MPNTVRDWMSSPVIVVDPDSSVSYAVTLMRRRNIHSLVVDINEENSSYGIFTTTDILDKIVGAGRSPTETRVREVMSSPVVTAEPDWTLKECSETMQKNRFHHMPVTDKNGELIGMISATDIFMAVEETGWEEKEN
jgi:CBS domain-containing protein